VVLCALTEQVLRLEWTRANNLPPSRSCTASSDRLFTTLDVLLAPVVKVPSPISDAVDEWEEESRPNQVFAALPACVALHLMAAFVWSPLRPRDLLMHGALDPKVDLKGFAALLTHVLLAMHGVAASLQVLDADVGNCHPGAFLAARLENPKLLLHRACFSEKELTQLQVVSWLLFLFFF
jgi:hypothetical protein